jgi:hypothetical protein
MSSNIKALDKSQYNCELTYHQAIQLSIVKWQYNIEAIRKAILLGKSTIDSDYPDKINHLRFKCGLCDYHNGGTVVYFKIGGILPIFYKYCCAESTYRNGMKAKLMFACVIKYKLQRELNRIQLWM